MLCWQSGFCGKFPQEHQVDTEYDTLAPSGHSKYENMVNKQKDKKWSMFGNRRIGTKQKADANSGSQQAGFLWRNNVRQEYVMVKTGKGGQETQARVKLLESRNNKLGELYPHMMNCIYELGSVYSIILDGERLAYVPPHMDGIDILAILELPRNRIRIFPPELGKCKRLERIILDWNQIDLMDQGIFSEKTFASLEVISIAHNRTKLCKLPDDFGTTRRPNRIKHIDLSDNSIAEVPESILECRELEFLDLSKNKIKRLPSNLGRECTKLKKIFLSFNPLTELPETIGGCRKCEHIRIIDCSIRVLPDSILQLWIHPDYNGRLEKLEVQKNPLIMPSRTAFEMGGPLLDRAFGLLQDHIRYKKEHEHKPRRASSNNQLTDGNTQQIVDLVAAGNELPQAEDNIEGIPGYDYYFKHTLNEEDPKAEVNEIRNAESTLLIIKTNMYFESQKENARRAEKSMGAGNLPKPYKQFLDPNFDISQWHESVRVTNLDLYFNLLVYSTKPLFSSCAVLFDRFECEGKDYLSREEWNELCLCVPILLDDESIKNQMWNLMSWRKEGRIFLKDFIAAWHIHDVETPDPWIQAMTKVLRLEYYDMSIEELRERLKAKDAENATPILNFDVDPEDSVSEGEDNAEDNAEALDRLEGERWIVASANDDNGNEKKGPGFHDNPHIGNLISLNDAQYAIYQTTLAGEGDNDADSDASMKSDALSEDGESSNDEEEFPIQWAQQSARSVSQGTGGSGPLYVDSDHAMSKLMHMDPKEFFRSQEKNDAAIKEAPVVAARKTPKKNKGKKMPSHDNHFRTDVFQVRQEIRQVYRNLPHDDFVKLISFLLRGMQQIQHSRVGTITYWHADDPTFKFTMGELCTNAYTRKLLQTMGFAYLTELLYWVWPEKHMSEVSKIAGRKAPIWGIESIPKSTWGFNEDRLDDMISLLKKCQKELHKKGKNFTGNFP